MKTNLRSSSATLGGGGTRVLGSIGVTAGLLGGAAGWFPNLSKTEACFGLLADMLLKVEKGASLVFDTECRERPILDIL